MRRSADFSSVVSSGARARTGSIVLHQHVGSASVHAPLVGFVVSKAVGGSVARHKVARRLRAQMSSRLDRLPAASGTVVRALPASASASSTDLGRDLERALNRLEGSR